MWTNKFKINSNVKNGLHDLQVVLNSFCLVTNIHYTANQTPSTFKIINFFSSMMKGCEIQQEIFRDKIILDANKW